MSSREMGTVTASAKIDIGPGGITITFPALDTDLAELIQKAGTFRATELEYHTFDTSDVYMKSDREIRFVDPEVVEEPDTP